MKITVYDAVIRSGENERVPAYMKMFLDNEEPELIVSSEVAKDEKRLKEIIQKVEKEHAEWLETKKRYRVGYAGMAAMLRALHEVYTPEEWEEIKHTLPTKMKDWPALPKWLENRKHEELPDIADIIEDIAGTYK